MSGYNTVEQAVGNLLTRFPRAKSGIEDVYQRVCYHLFADKSFKYELHEEATIRTVPEYWGVERDKQQYVGFYDICPWHEQSDAFFVHELNDDATLSIVLFEEEQSSVIGRTQAWNYQQGSRTQWHPGDEDILLFNDIRGEKAVTRLVGLDGENRNTISMPVQAVNPTGDGFLSINYRRLGRNSPGYGYGSEAGSDINPLSDDGIWLVGFDDSIELIVPLAELQSHAGADVSNHRHYLHHLVFSPSGNEFVFLYRWKESERRRTRLYISDLKGNIRLLSANNYISHFTWIDDDRLFLYGATEEHGRGYFVVDVNDGIFDYIPELGSFGDGHPSISPDGTWIVTDTYPNRVRNRTLSLFSLDTHEIIPVGDFFSPFTFDGPCRCDLHPRWSRDGCCISIDSAHTGLRESYVVDVSGIVD